jgi:hypothetical protein
VHNVTTSPATPPESAPSEARGATIIPFPLLRPAAGAPAAPAPAAPAPAGASPAAEPKPADRLARALANLNAALEEQRVAVANWRSVMGALKTSTAGLSDSLNHYNASLGALADRVSGVHKKAEELGEWADSVLATHR